MHLVTHTGDPFVTFQGVGLAPADAGAAYFRAKEGAIITGRNLFSPCFLPRAGGGWRCWYGGQLVPQPEPWHDEVYYSETTDETLQTGWTAPALVVPHGAYTHANDPSVAVGPSGTHVMALTVADPDAALAHGFRDKVAILASPDGGVTWPALGDHSREAVIVGPTPITVYARPTLIWDGDAARWELYFDGYFGAPQQPYRMHVAYSTELPVPHTFTWQGECGDYYDSEVCRVAGKYSAAYSRYADYNGRPIPIRFATSTDGLNWTEVPGDPPSAYPPANFPLGPWGGWSPWYAGGYSNPGWAVKDGGIVALGISLASGAGLDNNVVGLAFPQQRVRPTYGGGEHIDSIALSPDSVKVDLHGYTSFPDVLVRKSPGSGTATAGVLGDVWALDP